MKIIMAIYILANNFFMIFWVLAFFMLVNSLGTTASRFEVNNNDNRNSQYQRYRPSQTRRFHTIGNESGFSLHDFNPRLCNANRFGRKPDWCAQDGNDEGKPSGPSR